METIGFGRRAVLVFMFLAAVFAGTSSAQRAGPRPGFPAEEFNRPVELTPTEREIFDRTNDYRAQNGLPRVTVNPQLTRAARYFAIYMSITRQFDHDADGKGPGARASKFGYDWSLVCENIAYRYTCSDGTLRELPSDFVTGWIRSAGHRKNMLCDEVIETGVGVAVSKDPRHQYSVQVFGKPRGPVHTFRIQNDAGASVRYVLGSKVYTLRPGHTRVHPDSEYAPTYFESLDGAAHPIPMQRPNEPASWYRIVRDRRGGACVITSGPG
jgi:uncharacterized protein YkwD